jgi:hypothetical protein
MAERPAKPVIPERYVHIDLPEGFFLEVREPKGKPKTYRYETMAERAAAQDARINRRWGGGFRDNKGIKR